MIRWTTFFLTFAAAYAQSVNVDELVIPRKTNIFVTLERALSTKSASAGDRFYALVEVPITANDQIVVPVGSYILGQVDETRKPGYFAGKGELFLTFDTVIFPSGLTRRIVAIVQSAEDHESGEGAQEGKIIASSSQAAEVIEDATAVGPLGGAIGGARSGTLKGFGVGTAIGAATGAIIGLLRKGQDVYLPRGASLTIQLENDARFVKSEEIPEGKPLRP